MLNHNKCMEILVSYKLGLQKERLPHNYWEQLTMVARVGHYYGAPFKV